MLGSWAQVPRTPTSGGGGSTIARLAEWEAQGPSTWGSRGLPCMDVSVWDHLRMALRGTGDEASVKQETCRHF